MGYVAGEGLVDRANICSIHLYEGLFFCLVWLPNSLKKFCAYIKLPIELLSKWEGGGLTWLDCVSTAGWPETKFLCFTIRGSVVLVAGDYGT